MSTDGPEFDPVRLLTVLDQRRVAYLLVGGFAAQAHGAHRQTLDVDIVPGSSDENLGRLAAALGDLNAWLRVGGMSDDEARRLPVVLDVVTLRSFGSSTWMTDAGPLDVLAELRGSSGEGHGYDDLIGRRVHAEIEGITVELAALDDIVASKEFAGRPKDVEALPELRSLLDNDGEPGSGMTDAPDTVD